MSITRAPSVEPHTLCPTPSKFRFASRAQARRWLKSCRGNGSKKFRGDHAYRCVCGLWHVTSQPRDKAAA